MRRLSIAAPIYAIIGLTSAFSLMAIFFLLYQVGQVVDRYDGILVTQVRQQDMTRTMQVNFKKQVQEWKDLLLRGGDQAMYDKYLKAFGEREAATQKNMQELRELFVAEKIDTRKIDESLRDHLELGEKYRSALKQIGRAHV